MSRELVLLVCKCTVRRHTGRLFFVMLQAVCRKRSQQAENLKNKGGCWVQTLPRLRNRAMKLTFRQQGLHWLPIGGQEYTYESVDGPTF